MRGLAPLKRRGNGAQVCPIHGFARKHCTWRCAAVRLILRKLTHEFNQYWFDRKRGIRAMSLAEYRCRYDTSAGDTERAA